MGRFSPRRGGGASSITELTPEVEDLPMVNLDSALPDVGGTDEFASLLNADGFRRGNVREIMSFGIRQSYDGEIPDEQRSFSDVGLDYTYFPSRSFGLRFDSNINADESRFSSWGVSTFLEDDRGDLLRARYTYINNSISQLEGNMEIVLTSRFKLGGYARWDERDNKFIESEVALRMQGACNCWHLDLGVNDKINPDKQQVLLRFTLRGLGDLTQNIGLEKDNQR
jgi:hypothetical protein